MNHSISDFFGNEFYASLWHASCFCNFCHLIRKVLQGAATAVRVHVRADCHLAKIANWLHVTCNTYNIRYTISTYITQRSPGSPQFSSVPIEVPFLQPPSLTLLSPASMIRIWSIPCFTLIDKCQPGSK